MRDWKPVADSFAARRTIGSVGSSETRSHHPDRLGTRLVTGAGGTVVTEQLSMPFGTMLPFTQNYGGENSYQHPTLSNPSKKRFTSYDRSAVTELDYAVNRFYSSQQGRFTQVDPIDMDAASLSNPQTLNMYAYCVNDPINHRDPDGLFFGKLFGWIGKAFKFLFKVAAVALVVAAIVVFPGSAVAGLALLGLAGASGLAGWHNGKLGTIARSILRICSKIS
jgi:RHS repeat-associated protein